MAQHEPVPICDHVNLSLLPLVNSANSLKQSDSHENNFTALAALGKIQHCTWNIKLQQIQKTK